MHFIDAKGILTGSSGHCGMNIYIEGAHTDAFTVIAGAVAISLPMLLKMLR